MSDLQKMQRLTRFVNTFLMGYVVIMTGLFAHHGVNLMVYLSIPISFLYIWFFYLIHKGNLALYAALVYLNITLYMVVATACLGFYSGFQLYCFSLAPLAFYMYYFGEKLHTKKANPYVTSLSLVVIHLVCANYALIHGPIYQVDPRFTVACMNANALSVFACLIGYTAYVHKMVSDSETKLSDMAHTDRLTGLFNRHYMIEHMEERARGLASGHWIAMADIDGFKGINDTYGHNCGDYVLTTLAKIMRDICANCVIARWGGEEFLIANLDPAQGAELLEVLRQRVEQSVFTYQGREIDVTITIGTAAYAPEQSLDSWIQHADKKLYQGKNSTKNQVVY